MKLWEKSFGFVLALLIGMAPCVYAQQPDSTGSEDHPLVTRYQGAFIDGYEVLDFDEYVLALGPAAWNDAGKKVAKESEILEGKITRILYRGPGERSSLEIQRNYQSALTKAGFDILFSCGSECGNNFSYIIYGETEKRIKNTRTSGSAFDMPQDVRYLAATKTHDGATIHVSVLTAFDAGFGKLSKQPVTLLEVIESKAMDTDMVTVNWEAIGKGIDATGHMAIYGINFDTNSARIKPDSAPTLQEITKLLQARPKLNLLVVGHTDNQGGFDYNMNLSSQRAKAVERYLIDQHGIDARRLRSGGVGYMSPVATNASPQGRAKNRRVELVKN